MALSADRTNTERKDGINYEYPIAASAECFAGAMAVLDASGNCKPAVAATSLITVGRVKKYVIETTGVAAVKNVEVEAGVFRWKNSASNTLTKEHVGDTVYIEDDETVGSDGTGTSAAGTMVDIDSLGVWVETGPGGAGTVGLLAANNLSDVGSAATARTNLGVGTTDSPTFADVTTTDDVTVGDDLAVTGLATVGETLEVTGITTLSAILNADGGIAVDTNKFTVADTTGNTAIAGTLDVTGATSLTGLLNADGGIAVDTNKFTVSAAGAVAIASTLTVTGAAAFNGGVTCDTDKFTIANGTGNTAIAGTLAVTGAATGEAGFIPAASGTATLKTAKVTLSNAEIKGIRASPKELIAAPGAGKICIVEQVILSLNAGSEVLTESADNMVVEYSNSGVDITGAIEATGFIDQAADTTAVYPGSAVAAIAEATEGVNESVVLFNTGDGEYAGNASNDATMDVVVVYWEVTL